MNLASPAYELSHTLAIELAKRLSTNPPSKAALEDFDTGVVVAFNSQTKLENYKAMHLVLRECERGADLLAAKDVWRVRTARPLPEAEEVASARHDLADLRFYRFKTTCAPASVAAVFHRVREHVIPSPRYIWLRGRFVDPMLNTMSSEP